jgi:putative phosphoesterase
MKIAIISDIHAGIQALRRVLHDLPSVEQIWCAGDAISEYHFCPETVDLLQQAQVQCIQGNHEYVLFGGHNGAYLQKCQAQYGQEMLAVLAQAPTFLEMEAAGARILMVHASPWKPFEDYITPRSPQLRRFAELPYDFVILGHTHVPMVERVGTVTVINPGSCAQPRDQDPRGSYAILDLERREVEMRRLRID